MRVERINTLHDSENKFSVLKIRLQQLQITDKVDGLMFCDNVYLKRASSGELMVKFILIDGDNKRSQANVVLPNSGDGGIASDYLKLKSHTVYIKGILSEFKNMKMIDLISIEDMPEARLERKDFYVTRPDIEKNKEFIEKIIEKLKAYENGDFNANNIIINHCTELLASQPINKEYTRVGDALRVAVNMCNEILKVKSDRSLLYIYTYLIYKTLDIQIRNEYKNKELSEVTLISEFMKNIRLNNIYSTDINEEFNHLLSYKLCNAKPETYLQKICSKESMFEEIVELAYLEETIDNNSTTLLGEDGIFKKL